MTAKGAARTAAALGVALALGVGGAPAEGRGRGAADVEWDEGSRAAVDTWTQDEGCPARTSATESRAFTGPRVVAWKFQVSGEIEGDPLVWKDKTFVVERSGNRRTVHVLATATGAKLHRRSFDSVLPPAPCVDDGRLVLRATPKTVQGLVVGPKGLSAKWTITAKTAIGPPTLVRDEVYVVVDGVLERRTFGSKQAVWPKPKASEVVQVAGVPAAPAKAGGKPGPVDYPRPSVRGSKVYVATANRLLEVDRTTGAVRRGATLRNDADPTGRVMVGWCDVLVKRRGGEGATERFGRSDTTFAARTLLSLPYGAASLGCDWVARMEKAEGGPALVRIPGPDDTDRGSFDFATAKSHGDFVSAPLPPSVAQDVVFLAGRSFDADRLDLLEAEGVPCVARIVPLRDRLLVVEAKNKLVAYKSARERPAGAGLDLLGGVAAVPAAQAVFGGGGVTPGGFALDVASRTLVLGTGKPPAGARIPIASVHALVADGPPRRLLWGSTPEEAAEAVATLARQVAASEVLAIVPRAIEAGDADLARRVHAAAARLGAPEADLDAAEATIAQADAASPQTRDESKVEAVAQELRAALQRPADVLVEVAESLPAGSPPRFATALVRQAVAVYAYHPGATDWVRKALPTGLAPGTFRDLRVWLDFLDLVTGTEIEILVAGQPIPPEVPESVSAPLLAARAAWRPDLHGLRDGPLLVVATPDRLDVVARFLVLGRVVSDELDRLFALVGSRREDEESLILHFFPDREEYLFQSRGGHPSHGGGGLENSAGHYDPGANLTRIFLPSDPAGVEAVAGVYAHELTHHWIARRRPPRPGSEAAGDGAGGPGYWIVEGIADFVQGFDFDVPAARATLQNPRADYVDIVAHAGDGVRIPWSRLYPMTHADATPLLGEGELKIPLRWRMGTEGTFTTGSLFYAQAAATTAYLYLAEDGKRRGALLDFLYAHYAGEADVAAWLSSLGMTADELGQRVVAWCKATVTQSPR